MARDVDIMRGIIVVNYYMLKSLKCFRSMNLIPFHEDLSSIAFSPTILALSRRHSLLRSSPALLLLLHSFIVRRCKT